MCSLPFRSCCRSTESAWKGEPPRSPSDSPDVRDQVCVYEDHNSPFLVVMYVMFETSVVDYIVPDSVMTHTDTQVREVIVRSQSLPSPVYLCIPQ